MTGYGLDRVSILDRFRNFLYVTTSISAFGFQPNSYTVGTGDSFYSGVKLPEREADHLLLVSIPEHLHGVVLGNKETYMTLHEKQIKYKIEISSQLVTFSCFLHIETGAMLLR